MIPSSACQPWQPDRAANAAQEQRSYTTSRDTIRLKSPDFMPTYLGQAADPAQRAQKIAALKTMLIEAGLGG